MQIIVWVAMSVFSGGFGLVFVAAKHARTRVCRVLVFEPPTLLGDWALL